MSVSNPGQESIRDRVFHQAAAVKRLDGDVVALRELGRMFLGMYPEVLSSVKTAVEARDLTRAQYTTHRLLGTLSSFFAGPATTAAERLQDAIKAEQWTNADEQLPSIQKELVRLASEIRAFVDDVRH